jgi:hypothetical protein
MREGEWTSTLRELVQERERELHARDASVDSDVEPLRAVLLEECASKCEVVRANCAWMQTYTGRFYPLLAPRAGDVCIADIAYALSNLARYTGHARRGELDEVYSVAQHSVLASYFVPPEHAFAALMHDAAEAYVGDMSSPMKQCVPDFKHVERLSWLAIVEMWPQLPLELPEEVKHADLVMLATEKRDLMAPEPRPWIPLPEPRPEPIEVWPADVACAVFLQRFAALVNHEPKPAHAR